MQKACWVLIIFLVILGGSCLDNDICLRGADNALIIEFKKFSNGVTITDTTASVQNIRATGTNAVFYYEIPEDTINDLEDGAIVTVNPYESETTFTFNNFKGDTLTLTVGYKTEVRFVSEECGSERLQYDLKMIATTFDSVRVINNSLNKGRSTNIEIFH